MSDAVDSLAAILADANRATYHDTISAYARAFGADPPATITDADVLAGIQQRAAVSAQSIVRTQADRATSLLDAQDGNIGMAQEAFSQWWAGQSELISQYEAASTAAIAAGDFIDRNPVTGTAHVEPTDTAGLDDECDEAVALGEIPLDETAIDLPAHPRCPHYYVYAFDPVADPTALWLGE